MSGYCAIGYAHFLDMFISRFWIAKIAGPLFRPNFKVFHVGKFLFLRLEVKCTFENFFALLCTPMHTYAHLHTGS